MKKTILLLLVASTAALASEWGCGTLGAFARYDGNPLLNVDLYGTGYDSLCAWNSADGGISVNATGSEIHVLGFNYNNAYSLYQDGVLLNRIKTDSTTVFTDITLATGLSGQHLYRIVTSSSNVQWGVALVATVTFVGGGPVGVPPSAQPVIEACGDSNIGSPNVDDSTTVDWWLLSQALGTSAQIYSASGASVSGTISTRLALQCAIKMVLAGNASPAVLVLEGGAQDAASALPIGDATTLGTFTGDYVYMIRSTLNNAHPPTNLLVRGIPDNVYTNYASLPAYRAAQKAAVDYVNAADGAHVCYYSTTGWLTPSPFGVLGVTDMIEGLHIEPAMSLSEPGFGKMANHEEPILDGDLNGSSFVVTGPTSVVVGVPATFTVSLRNGATWHGESVTPTDAGAGGTFAYGSMTGTSALTIPVSTTGATWQLTYTASSTGAKAISFTGLPDCWHAPSISFTATSGTQQGGGTTSFTVPLHYVINGVGAPYPITVDGPLTITVSN